MTIVATILPVTHDLGAFQVRRVLPNPQRVMVGPFIFVDEFGPAIIPAGQAMDVRPHPHIGLATVTWLFEGAIDHRDSLGNFATIRPGQVNLMTAGQGIVHSERGLTAERENAKPIYGMQTWLALPDGQEDIAPAFESHADLPLVDDGSASARIMMGSLWGRTSPTTQHAATIYAEIILAPGGSIPIDDEADERAVMLVGGEASIDGVYLELFALSVLAPGMVAKLKTSTGGRVILLGGEAFATPRHVWWNFVHSARERINQAKRDWTEGRFPLVPGDIDDFIPLPQRPLTSSDR
ncbi:pirin family protein [Novosphingobium sp.]|uniref:pirin family protein n=1 Tax=Novosphingobium sp. TaxID=1874826 RepID=UPI0025CF14F9|nr:pirin family protein [Novosphingobium sp.]